MSLRSGGSDRVWADSARVRAARRRANLRRTVTRLEGDSLTVAGRISRRARGVVRVSFGYVGDDGRERFLAYKARVRRGRWRVRELVPSIAAREGGHVSIQFTGHLRRRIRGEQLAKSV